MNPDNQHLQPPETDSAGLSAESAPIEAAAPKPVPPAVSALVGALPIAVIAGLAAAYWPLWASSMESEALTVLFWTAPVVSGILAACIHLRNYSTRRANLWKCSVWIWTWALLFLAICCVPLRSDFATFVIIGLPYLFVYHGFFMLLALVGLGIGKFIIGLRSGWERWPTPAKWRRYSALLVLVILLHLMTKMCTSNP